MRRKVRNNMDLRTKKMQKNNRDEYGLGVYITGFISMLGIMLFAELYRMLHEKIILSQESDEAYLDKITRYVVCSVFFGVSAGCCYHLYKKCMGGIKSLIDGAEKDEDSTKEQFVKK